MARNRSEKSPSGDPMVDEALRAELRVMQVKARGHIWLGGRRRLEALDNDAYLALNSRQRSLRSRMRNGNGGSNPMDNLMALYGHEDEFKHGTKSK